MEHEHSTFLKTLSTVKCSTIELKWVGGRIEGEGNERDVLK